MKPSDLQRALEKLIPHNKPILITGAPGIGKTDIVNAAAKNAIRPTDGKPGFDVHVTHPVVSDPTDVKGLPMSTKDENGNDRALWLPFGDLEVLIEADSPLLCFIDDVGQAPPAVQAAWMQILLARRINEHKVSDHVTFAAASNRKEDKAGVTGVLEPVKSRFATILELETDHEDWAVWAFDNEMPPELIAFIKFRPNELHNYKPQAEIKNSSCPRTVAFVGKMMQMGIPEDLEMEVYAGAAGHEFAGQLVAFLKTWRNLPDPDKALENPKYAEERLARADPATMYAFSGAIAYRAKKDNIDKVISVCDVMDDEFAVCTIKQASQRDRALKKTPEFVKWVSKKNDILV